VHVSLVQEIPVIAHRFGVANLSCSRGVAVDNVDPLTLDGRGKSI